MARDWKSPVELVGPIPTGLRDELVEPAPIGRADSTNVAAAGLPPWGRLTFAVGRWPPRRRSRSPIGGTTRAGRG